MARPRQSLFVRIRGRLWRLLFTRLRGDADGLCDPPDAAERTIRIHCSLSDRREMCVIIHECLHAGCWDLAEEAVTELAEDIEAVLHRCGFGRLAA